MTANGDLNWSALAYAAMERDLIEALSSEGVDVNGDMAAVARARGLGIEGDDLVGSHAGVGIGEDGYSQQGLEDIALMRVLPTMSVIQPADDLETEGAVGEQTLPASLQLASAPQRILVRSDSQPLRQHGPAMILGRPLRRARRTSRRSGTSCYRQRPSARSSRGPS